MSNTLSVVLHIPLVDQSLQFHLFRIHNIPLVHPILKKSFRYSIQEEYLIIRLDKQYISFPLSTDRMACQVSNGWFCHINSPLYAADTSNSCSYAIFCQDKNEINRFCILSVINQTQDEAVNISDNIWAISTIQNNKKLYITCLQYSYAISLHFAYDIICLWDRCEASAISFVLPSNNQLNVDSIMEFMENKLGFSRSYSKINNFSLMQSLDISSLTDDNLKILAQKITEMKHMSVFSINNTLKIRSLPPTFWSSMEAKLLSTIGTPIMTIIILLLIIILYCKCFWHKRGWYVNTLDQISHNQQHPYQFGNNFATLTR